MELNLNGPDHFRPISYTVQLPIFRRFWKGAIVAVRIRMKRMGRKHRPYYRIVAIDSRQPRDGRTLEDLGTYDPMVANKENRLTLVPDRIKYWMSVGALPTEKVAV